MFNLFKKKVTQDTQLTKNEPIYALASGQVIAIEEVSDVVFSQKMMGDGFAIIPTDGTITSPVNGTVTSIFPSQHAISITTPNNVEVLVHMGLNTVELDGKGFDTKVSVGDKVSHESILSLVDLEYIKSQGKDTAMIVIFTNMDIVEQFSIKKEATTYSSAIGELTLK